MPAIWPGDSETVEASSHKLEAVMRWICLDTSIDVQLMLCDILVSVTGRDDLKGDVAIRLPPPPVKMLDVNVTSV